MDFVSVEKGLDAHDSQGVSNNASYLKSQSYEFAAQYLGDGNSSYTPQGEDQGTAVTASQITADENGGLHIVSIFENYGMSDAMGAYSWLNYLSYNQGVTDAEAAYSAAQNVGQPVNSAIYFAMDFDPGVNPATAPAGYTEAKGLDAVIKYFEGINYVFGTEHPGSYQVGVYGAVDTLLAVLGQLSTETGSAAQLAQDTWRTVSTGWAGNYSTAPDGNAGGGATEDNNGNAWTMIQSNEDATVTNPNPPVPDDASVEIDDDNTSTTSFGQWDNLPCFCRGTRILTTRGEVAVEELRVGDVAVTFLGSGAALKPVRWLGHRRIELRGQARADEVRPVRIRAGALGESRPQRDLLVSPGHRFPLDGVLVAASDLVNGAGIVQESPAEVEYWHVELDTHDLILAEGVATESYLDTGNRSSFEDSRVVALHPVLDGDGASPCLPYAEASAALRQRLIGRSEALGFVRVIDPAPWLEANGLRILPERDGTRYRFRLPRGCAAARLCSLVTRPYDVDPGCADRRELGLSLQQMVLHTGEGEQPIALDDPRLAHGFSYVERDGMGHIWRWTTGAAELPLAALAEGRTLIVLEITLDEGLAYWARPQPAPQSGELAA